MRVTKNIYPCSMAWVFWALVTATTSVALIVADGGGYGHPPAPVPIYQPQVPSYHPPPPPPVSYAAIPVYAGSSGGKKGGRKFGNLFKGFRSGFSLFGGKGRGKGKGGSGPVITPVHIPAPPPIKQHHVLNVKVPKCQPLTHYITQYITEAHPVSGSPTHPEHKAISAIIIT